MRTASAVAGAAALLVASLASPGPARAGATVDLLFVAVNGAPIAATDTVTVHRQAGDLLTMALVMSNDEPLSAYSFSLEFDRSDVELEVVSAVQWLGIAVGARGADYRPIVDPCTAYRACQNSSPGSPGYWGIFNAVRDLGQGFVPPALPPGSYQVGTVTWRTRAAKADGEDVFAGLFLAGVDGVTDGDFELIDAETLFRSASVILNPEPGTALLLGTGLCALAAARRARRP